MKFSIDNIKTFLIRNWKYLTAAVAFILIVIILVSLSNKANQADQQKEAKIIEEQVAEQEEEMAENVEPANSLSTEEHPEINNLIQTYFNSMANNDVETLKTILAEMHPEDEESVKTGSEYTESYNNIICYTKPGKTENSYVVFASYEAKFVGINTTAPGLLSFYVQTKEDGSLYIQNKLEDGLKEYIQNIVVEDTEVANLFEASQKRYEQALTDDAALKEFVAGLENVETKTSEENTQQPEETTEQPAENTEQKSEESSDGGEQKQESTVSYVKAKENVNVRNDASETADAIGKLLGGETAEKTGEKDGWICINYKGQPGYVKADFVESTSDGTGSVSKETTENTSAEKTYVYVKETVNVRGGMSQDSDKVGTAYTGDKYAKIQDYKEGWTKIEYNGKEAYIKTEFLETR